ncbi:hypothetical protein DFH06DRAFT_991118 [Mycena polygramma]|nr:hypothetical protein DFH06DRAFT_991118 [Mycena polygramma]
MDNTPAKPMIMELATNSVRNTTFATADDDPYYEVVTRFWHPRVTKINKLDPATRIMTTVCEIDSKGKEAKIRFAEESTKGEKKLEHRLGANSTLGEGGIFVDSDGVRYRWKTHNRNFLLIECGDEGRLPLVVYRPHKRHLGFWRMSQHAALEIKPQMCKDLERLIASYLLVERHRRHRKF